MVSVPRGRHDPVLERDARALYKALTRLARASQFRDREHICVRGISVTQSYALTALAWHGPMTLNQLASHLYLDKSTVSRVVDAMERKGIVQRRPHRESRRAIELRPTAKGRRLHHAIQKDMVEREKQLLSGFDPKTRAALIDVIGRLVEEVEERAQGLPGDAVVRTKSAETRAK
jgi:DNA-binding MarR family transcriptional regulator